MKATRRWFGSSIRARRRAMDGGSGHGGAADLTAAAALACGRW
jgi:hypothetical protein